MRLDSNSENLDGPVLKINFVEHTEIPDSQFPSSDGIRTKQLAISSLHQGFIPKLESHGIDDSPRSVAAKASS